MPDPYKSVIKEDGPTTKKIRRAIEAGASPQGLALTLASVVDKLLEALDVSEAERLQNEAEKGYSNGSE